MTGCASQEAHPFLKSRNAMCVTALREAALGERRLERGPTPGRDGASCGAGLMNQGDDRRNEHRGKDHKKDEEREQILGHLLLAFLSERGGGGI
jgi:hypothetical protein